MNEQVKQFLVDNKQSIEIFQWAVMNGVASLVYSDFIAAIKQKLFPVRKVLVPSIKDLEYLMDVRGKILKDMPEYLLGGIVEYYTTEINVIDKAPELSIFNEDNLPLLKDLMYEYMMPNVSRRIPETIVKKFGLDNPDQQVIREDRDIRMFDKYPLDDKALKFITIQTALQLLNMPISIEKEECPIENNDAIVLPMDRRFIMSIKNDQAVCPVEFNRDILDSPIMDLLQFVTGTTYEIKDDTFGLQTFVLQTLPLNIVSLTRLLI